MSEFPYLFSPIKLGGCVIPNRINFAAHLTNLSENHQISDGHIHYYAERAKGGCGLITTEELTVHPSDLAYPKLVDAFVPEVIPGFLRLTRTIHETDTKIFAQLNHNGMQADGKNSLLPVWGPSNGKDPLFRETAKAMEIEEIKECVVYFAKSARHVVEGGFDGIELQLGHSSLIRQFISPATNHRKDMYGGSFDNRMRFGIEVVEAVRKAVGAEYALGIRLNADEMHPKGGLTHQDACRAAKIFEGTGLIDFINISLGTFHNLFLVEGSMHTPLAYTTGLSAGIRSVVELPVYATNRINDPHLAETILQNGQGDVINMVRALIADPELPNKSRQGRTRDIRHCIACNQGCIGRMGLGFSIGCMQTPCAGNEEELGKGTIKLCESPKKIVVVGAGPAGLETARVAALRRHQVILMEKNDTVGGQNLIAAKAAGRGEILGVTRWLHSQVNQLDIDVRLGCEASPDLVLAEHPDVVVVATGSMPKENPFPGEYRFPDVVNSIQVLTGQAYVGKRVLVIDQNGHHHGTGTAQFLADQGKKVHVLVPALFQGAALGPLQDLFLARQRLAVRGVTCTPDIAVLEIDGTQVQGLNVYSNEMIEFKGYDTIVTIAGNVSDDMLYFKLKDRIKALYRVGDCAAPRLTDSAIAEGHRVGREL